LIEKNDKLYEYIEKKGEELFSGDSDDLAKNATMKRSEGETIINNLFPIPKAWF